MESVNMVTFHCHSDSIGYLLGDAGGLAGNCGSRIRCATETGKVDSSFAHRLADTPKNRETLLLAGLSPTIGGTQVSQDAAVFNSTNVKPGTTSEPPVLVKDFPPLTPVQAQQQTWVLRRQNQILARNIQELEAKQVRSSEPVQEAEADDVDDGSSVTSHLTSVSRQEADTVVGPASITGPIGRVESLERFVTRKLSKEASCATCKQSLEEKTGICGDPEADLVNCKTRGYLKHPNIHLYLLSKEAEEHF
ncbi:hypothetical protein HPB50_018851 [Hyalomma asiaticum]|uniref:Uncharacterized protein n=1 Tax=Hyalomma asiaticum TaxID=266040 RepID=A0ACB7SIN1_HYAAI|nr:hypothetical protein HPB50_018851 [Hyalomma asiaticum]